MFTLQFGTTDKARNSTYVPPVSGSTVEVLLKDATSIIRPVFRIHCGAEGMAEPSELFGYNYCYCAEFRRYYYISDIVEYTAKIFDIMCEVDVLATFRDDILQTDAFVMYAESMYDGTLSDTRLPKCTTSTQKTVDNLLPGLRSEGSFALTVASENANGETGCSQTYLMNATQMALFASTMFSTGTYDQIVKYLTNPLDAVISCTWTPIAIETGGSGAGAITIAGQSMGSGMYAKKNIEGEVTVEPYIKYIGTTVINGAIVRTYGDYRNYEPFAEYSLVLPGVGIVQIPMIDFVGDGLSAPSFNIKYVASPCTGSITYSIRRNVTADQSGEIGATVMTISGNFGVNVPVAQRNTGFASAIANIASAVGSAAVSIATMGSAPIVAGRAMVSTAEHGVGAIASIATQNTAVSGTLGGWAADKEMYTALKCITRNFDISDSPANVGKTIGRPLFETHKLSEFSGLVKCTGAYVKTWATEGEHQMIADYVNTSVNYLYGGLIVE